MSARDRLVATASALFERSGYHATGIDTILAEAGVAKMTLYNHFGSKEALILEVLHRRDAATRERLARRARAQSATARERLLALFDALGEWFRSPDFHGCMFIAAGGEFAEASRSIRAAARDHKRMIAAEVAGWAKEAGAREPDLLGRQLAMLADGAIVAAQLGGGDPASDARRAAEALVDAAIPTGRRSRR